MLQSGTCDCVAARRSSREGEGKIKSFLSNAFYGVINRLSRTEIVSGARDYRLMSRKMVDAVLEMSEYNRFSKGIFGWVGF
ncbi:glycosyltransferase, partial [Vibrio parahaemolyticus]|nr:glycosyltransferase [Vibrio parahaemolyticus]